jgi:hypothetical protein
MDKESIINKVLENTPLVIMVIGLVLVVIGAAGGLAKADLRIDSSPWRIALAIMGTIVFIVGGLFLWREKSGATSAKDLSKDYGIKITYPQDAAEVGQEVEVLGTYETRPPDNLIRVLEHSPTSQHYWPKRYATFNSKQKTWSATTRVGGNPNDKRVIVVASIGEGGRALFDYYEKVGKETKQWIGIRTFPSDVKECDRIIVKRI